MNFWDYIKLSREDKIELLYEEGESEEGLGKGKYIFTLYDFWVEVTENSDGDIIYLKAHLFSPH